MAECGVQAEGGRRRREAGGGAPSAPPAGQGRDQPGLEETGSSGGSFPGARGSQGRVQTHALTHIHVHAHAFVHTHARTNMHTPAHTLVRQAHVPAHLCPHLCPCTHAHTCTRTHVRYTCMHTHTRTHMHTMHTHTHTALHSTHTHTRVNTPVRVPSGETLLCASPAAASPAWPCPGHSPSRGEPRAASVSLSPALLLSCMSLALQGPAGTFRLCPSAAPAHPRENRIVIALSV